jgi:organic hydroperoxide reductase OsmC/OhrA
MAGGGALRYEFDMPTHHFEGTAVWSADAPGAEQGNHTVAFADRDSLSMSSAPQYRGDPTRLNPEELLAAAVVSCQLLTYLALARRAEVPVVRYEDTPVATLAIAEKKMRVTEVLLRPVITLGAGADEAKARALVDQAHDGCFIANSVRCEIRLEPTFVTTA